MGPYILYIGLGSKLTLMSSCVWFSIQYTYVVLNMEQNKLLILTEEIASEIIYICQIKFLK